MAYALSDFTTNKIRQGLIECFLQRQHLGFFGAAPDKFFPRQSDAIQLLRQLLIDCVTCIDTKRAIAAVQTRDLPNKLSWSSVTYTYKKVGIEFNIEHQGVPLHIGDSFELLRALKTFISPQYHDAIIKVIKSTNGVKNTVEKHGIQLSKNVLDEMAKCHTANLNYMQCRDIIDSLSFFPTDAQINAFVDLIMKKHTEKKRQYIHCASGLGRTGYYLLRLLIQLTNCSNEDGLGFIRTHYNARAVDEIQNYL